MTDSEPPAERSLTVLRTLIDQVDHEILQLLARRHGLVGEVAAWKRSHGVRIRDARREREIIADRRDRGAAMGLSPEVIENLYRLTLWASRDRQAALRAEVPPETPRHTIGIVGGKGQMGRCLAGMFSDLGQAVIIADLDTDLSAADAAAEADVVVVSVPIEDTLEVVDSVGPHVRPGCLLMDVTSIKGPVMAAMLGATDADVLGTHPLFGPSVHSLQGQRIVVTPGRGDRWREWITSMFRARGLVVHVCSPEEHDRAMSIVQVLTHFSTEVLGRTLATLGVPIEQTLRFTSPVYLMELLMAARHFAQSPDLYASIQMSNPDHSTVTRAFVEAAATHRTVVEEGDRNAMRHLFAEVRRFFGPFGNEAIEQSSYMIDRLVERMK